MAVMNGVARGIVTDSLDPMRKGRVRLRLPALPGGDSSWAASCAASLRPGDEVIVAFEHGDINRPVVLGKLSG
ncbi:MAG: hypothetical protein KF889_25695 [Alphaproteobacteria bacterium]|nr:hypothetical protein [Alphaproteobacteria bacterium]MCW5739611.1 hypothetical protein [Alphaproteobacteria bacterium]